MINNNPQVDIAIIGGGIAGLWLLTRLRQACYSAILLEANTIGGGQTYQSQGIIHGGLKYALHGVLTDEAKVMAEMPARWQTALNGSGEIDLTGVNILSDKQYLFASNKFTAKIAGFFAGMSLSSKVESLSVDQYPQVFQTPAFKGDLYALNESVIDVPSLLSVLFQANREVIFKVDQFTPNELHCESDGSVRAITLVQQQRKVEIAVKYVIFAAGSGNEVFLLNEKIQMQRRPLQMVMLCMEGLPPLYAHCLALGARPRLTITTHYLSTGLPVWYLGGLLAEEGVTRTKEEQIEAAKRELKSVFPWVSFARAQFATHFVDRAEPKEMTGLKPNDVFCKAIHNQIITWPIKLAFAPRLSDQVLEYLQKVACKKEPGGLSMLSSFVSPSLSTPLWEECFCKKDN